MTKATSHFEMFVNGGADIEYRDTFDERRKLEDSDNIVSGCPGLVWYHDGIHDLVWPCVLQLETLLVFKGKGRKRTNNSDRSCGLEIVSETRSSNVGSQLVRDGNTTKDRSGESRGQVATQLELERETVASSLERVTVLFFSF
jgi:hypothetical protein